MSIVFSTVPQNGNEIRGVIILCDSLTRPKGVSRQPKVDG